jgi:putative transposase
MSPVKRTSHAVYDLNIISYGYQSTGRRVEEIFRDIADVYEFEIEKMAIVEDHVHIFLSAPPKYAPGEIVRIFKSRSAKVVFKEFPEVRRELWGGELWSDGYFVRSVGDEVTTEIISRYIEYHKHHSEQLSFDF